MAQTAFVLLVMSDEPRGEALRDTLRRRFRHSAAHVRSAAEALDSLRQRAPDVLVLDDQPPSDRDELLRQLESSAPDAAALLIAGPPPSSANLPAGRLTVERITPADATDDARLAESIDRAAAKAVSRREDRLQRESFQQRPIEAFEGIVGISPGIQRIIERIKKVAQNKLTVLILGETGTGKELIAQAIHRWSDRARKPYKPLNCAGLNENLLESELFGHVRGAFTGAISDRKGYFLAADGGTLFLDEIGDMPLTMQVKLLRALEHREITPVGSTDVVRVDVRVIAATNANLRQAVDDKKFRDDLYYRLRQWEIVIPPLRERRQDIPLLAHHFVELANREHALSVPGISSDALGALTRHHWPGNVRELRNVIESVSCEVIERRIELDDLPEDIRGTRDIVPVSAGGLVGLTMEQVERLMIERTLAATGGNREEAAKILNIGIRTLYRKLKEYGVQEQP
jgi:two-component system response regulator HydG